MFSWKISDPLKRKTKALIKKKKKKIPLWFKGVTAASFGLSRMFFGCHLLAANTLHSSDGLLVLVSAARSYGVWEPFFPNRGWDEPCTAVKHG